MMSGLHTDVQLVKRVQRKFERLEKQCSERYQLREAKVKVLSIWQLIIKVIKKLILIHVLLMPLYYFIIAFPPLVYGMCTWCNRVLKQLWKLSIL